MKIGTALGSTGTRLGNAVVEASVRHLNLLQGQGGVTLVIIL